MRRPAKASGLDQELGKGFTLVEMMVASAVLLVVMAVVFAAVTEGQRSVSTIEARNADVNAAQAFIDEMALSVRGATKVSVLCLTGGAWGGCPALPNGETQGEMLLTYHVGPSGDYVNYNKALCTAWFFNSSHQLDYSSWSTPTSSGGSLPTPSPASVELSGLQAGSFFSYFSAYPGLVDISLSVLEAGTANASSLQQASSPSMLEEQVDNPFYVQNTPPSDC
jgi:prepilin-type N-terminal cleavage/methylation domain-containing protein